MYLIIFFSGVAAGMLFTLINYAIRPRQKKGKYHFSEQYEKYVPLADAEITKNTRKDKSIETFK